MLWWTLRQLRSSKPRARASAARQLSASRDARAFAALSGAALEDRDATVRLSATKALAALENPSAIAPLLHLALADPIDSVRQAAATNLPQVDADWPRSGSAQAALGSLIIALVHDDADVRSFAAEHLERVDANWMGSEAVGCALPELARRLGDAAPVQVRTAAVAALERIGGPESLKALILRLGDEDTDFHSLVMSALNGLDADWRQSPAATEALSSLCVPPERSAELEPRARECVRLTRVLRHIGQPRALRMLDALVEDRSAPVRAAALEAIHALDAVRAADRAILADVAALRHGTRNDPTRKDALERFARNGDPRATDALLAVLTNNDEDDEARINAARALGRIGDGRATRPLLGMALAFTRHRPVIGDRTREGMREWGRAEDALKNMWPPAAEALERIDPSWRTHEDARKALPDLIELALCFWMNEGDHCRPAVRALDVIDAAWRHDKRVRAAVPGMLKVVEEDSDHLLPVLHLLGAIRDPRALGPLRTALLGRQLSWAAETLGEIGHPQGLEALVEALSTQSVRWSAALALSKLGSEWREREDVVDALVEAVADGKEQTRWYAAEGLARSRTARAVDALLDALEDEDDGVVDVAARVMGEIREPGAAGRLLRILCRKRFAGHVRQALVAIGEAALPTLAGALADNDIVVRRTAAEALGAIGGNAAVEALIAALKDPDNSVKGAAASGIITIAPERLSVDLAAALEWRREFLREKLRELRESAREVSESWERLSRIY